MRALDLLPRLDEIAPNPATDLPAFMIWLAVDEGRPSPGWAELRERLVADRGVTPDEAETIILAAIRAEDVRARLDPDSLDGWEVSVTPVAARAVLLRYAVGRFEKVGLDLDDFAAYDEADRRIVLAMIPELVPLSEGETPPPDPALYRRLLNTNP